MKRKFGTPFDLVLSMLSVVVYGFIFWMVYTLGYELIHIIIRHL